VCRDHIPTPQGDQCDRYEATHDTADDFCPALFEFVPEARPELAPGKPAERAANEKADQTEDWRAKQQGGIPVNDRGRNPQREQPPSRADNGPNQGAHVRFRKRGASHPLFSKGMKGRGSGPMYSAVGRISRLSPRCSMMCADHPEVREITKIGVNIGVGIPQKWKAAAL
jgi:hypothetical protein